MTFTTDSLVSQRFEVTGSLEDAIEFCYRQGWTDGLPVVPPTEEKVLQFLEWAGKEPADIIGIEPIRGRVITAEKVAINAVMAGCRPEYMPVVLAAVECMVQPEYNLHGSSISTGSSAPLLVINGPVRQKLGFNSGYNLFGPGPQNRANATVGRAVRLLLINVLENHPGVFDLSTMGHPGKYTYCIAEDEEHSPWEPLHMERGFPPQASTVTVFTSMAPTQFGYRRGGTPEALLTGLADLMLGFGFGHEEMLLVLSDEHQGYFREAGWSKQQVRDFLFQKARRTRQQWAWVYEAEEPTAGSEQEEIPVLKAPESLVIIAGGGPGGPWSALVPRWVKGIMSRSVTRQIDTSRIL